MFDVLPPTPSGGQGDFAHQSGKKKFSRRIRSNRPQSSPIPAVGGSRPSVVSLNWKLPSRLRKPIREQLEKERRKQQLKRSVIRFERRPLVTRVVKNDQPMQNMGAEHHTGDVYKKTAPTMRVALPPYMGGFSRKFSSTKRVARPLASSAALPPKKRVVAAPVVKTVKTPVSPVPRHELLSNHFALPMQTGLTQAVRKETTLPVTVELPSSSGAIQQPRRRFSMPFSFSFWPKSVLTTKKKFHGQPFRRFSGVGANIGVLLVGFVFVMGLVWSLQGAGRGTAVLSSVESKAQGAYEKILSAQAAFAETNFNEGQQQLSQAGQLLGAARGDLSDALAATEHILRVVDVTGVVRSGSELLEAGQELTGAGQHIAKGAGAFFNVEVFADQKETTVQQPQTLLEALQFATQEFNTALPQLDRANTALAKVESPLLPENVASEVDVLKTAVPKVTSFLRAFLSQSGTLAQLLGDRQSRQYLLLFANQDELRPVGGFIGSVGLVNVDKGQVENIDVDSVYDPDGQLKEMIAPPDPLLSITSRWYMRDANWFVDYEQSAKKVSQFFEKEGGPTVDGVILITPEVIKRLLVITGPLKVPGYDVVLTTDNFQQITQNEVTYSYDRTVNKPKQFLADVTPLLLNKLFSKGEGSASYGAVVQALSDAASSKDLLLYFRDDQVQQQVRIAGWSGAVPQNVPGLLYVNNANIGGHKSDQFIDQEIDYRVEVGETGKAEAVVTVRRTHRGPDEKDDFKYPDYENPHYKDNIDFQRVLVPAGSRLLEAKGYTPASAVPRLVIPKAGEVTHPDADLASWQSSIKQDSSGTLIGSEAGYTFFANWVITKPGQTTVTLYRYELPQNVLLPQLLSPASRYSLMVVKQPGAQRTTVRASLKLPDGMSIVHAVPPSGITQESDNELVYRGALSNDILFGGVFERR